MYYLLILLVSLSQLLSFTESKNVATRIIGGDNIYESVPYQISFQMFRNGKWSGFCGGSIISEDFVLTAAHCVDGLDAKKISVLAGTNSLKSREGSRHFVSGFKIHEQFEKLRKNDIALVKVFPPFALNGKTVDAIGFTDTTPIGEGVPVILTGWGSLDQSGRGPLPDQLQVLTTYTLSESVCKEYFSPMESTEMCTFRANRKGACNGDSGGPLASIERKRLIGVVAFGSKLCASGFPDYFTKVTPFVPWILTNMNK